MIFIHPELLVKQILKKDQTESKKQTNNVPHLHMGISVN
jgi:hypothetical protein